MKTSKFHPNVVMQMWTTKRVKFNPYLCFFFFLLTPGVCMNVNRLSGENDLPVVHSRFSLPSFVVKLLLLSLLSSFYECLPL
uniref:Uncharacterized protein n=1 Tax=Ixodes scapularis TaxID=6945 RepID=A0A4D5S160_IXOSC